MATDKIDVGFVSENRQLCIRRKNNKRILLRFSYATSALAIFAEFRLQKWEYSGNSFIKLASGVCKSRLLKFMLCDSLVPAE